MLNEFRMGENDVPLLEGPCNLFKVKNVSFSNHVINFFVITVKERD